MRPGAIRIELTYWEICLAASVGTSRRLRAIAKGFRDQHGFRSDKSPAWEKDIQGAAGELVVARATGQFWAGSMESFSRGSDVGKLEVKTRPNHADKLIVRPPSYRDDRAEWDKLNGSTIVLVTGAIPAAMLIQGWIKGADVTPRDDWWGNGGHDDRPGCWWVPQSALRPPEELEIFRPGAPVRGRQNGNGYG